MLELNPNILVQDEERMCIILYSTVSITVLITAQITVHSVVYIESLSTLPCRVDSVQVDSLHMKETVLLYVLCPPLRSRVAWQLRENMHYTDSGALFTTHYTE